MPTQSYPLAQFNIGNLYDELGRLDDAQEHYRMALELNPQYADAHFNLALLCERQGDNLKSRAPLEELSEVGSRRPVGRDRPPPTRPPAPSHAGAFPDLTWRGQSCQAVLPAVSRVVSTLS